MRRRSAWLVVCGLAVAAVTFAGATVAGHGATDARLRGWVASLHPPTASASFAGAPPPFEIPAGGSVRIAPDELGRRVTLLRADGTRFAETVVTDDGLAPEVGYFDARGRLSYVADALFGDPSCAPCAPRFFRPGEPEPVAPAAPVRSQPTATCDSADGFAAQPPAGYRVLIGRVALPIDVDARGLAPPYAADLLQPVPHSIWVRTGNAVKLAVSFPQRGVFTLAYDGATKWRGAKTVRFPACRHGSGGWLRYDGAFLLHRPTCLTLTVEAPIWTQTSIPAGRACAGSR